MKFTRLSSGAAFGVVSFLIAFFLVVALPHAAFTQVEVQQTAQPKRIGFADSGTAAASAWYVAELREGLREHGWIEGKNIVIESRFAGGNFERLAEIAAELVRMPVDVLVTTHVPSTLVLKKATHTIPIVTTATDPAGTGLVTPGGNVAAFDVIPADAAGRQIEVLREVVPGLSRMALVWNGENPAAQLNAQRAREAAQAAGLRVIPIEVQAPAQLDGALAGLRDKGAQAIFFVADPALAATPLVATGLLTTSTGLPTICQMREWADLGCVVAYGTSARSVWRQSVSYVDRILKGARPADLPIGRPTRFELAINAGSAKTIGLTIPPSVLKRADTVLP